MTGEKGKEKGSCEYPMHDDKPCGRDLYDVKHCIFHSEDIEGKRKEFENKFWEEFERQKAQGEIYDFTGFVFPGDISFEEREFEKDVSFWAAQFSGEADFEGAQFSGKADFWDAEFHSKSFFF